MARVDQSEGSVGSPSGAGSAREPSESGDSGWIELVAPAKVNLVLDVGDRLESGFHRVSTILHALNLHDTVRMRRTVGFEGGGLSAIAEVRASNDVEVPAIAPADNLAARAVMSLARRLGRAEDERIEILIDKSIPVQAGLGGGSSDAAAALAGACALWDVDAGSRAVLDAACEVGSDVAFFLQGGCAAFSGKGDRFVRSLRPSKCPVVLVKPDRGVSTAAAYREFDKSSASAHHVHRRVLDRMESADDAVLLNNLAAASEALEPELAEVRRWLEVRCGEGGVLLCGSGSCTFALCEGFDEADAISIEARRRGWWSCATSLGSLKAAVVR